MGKTKKQVILVFLYRILGLLVSITAITLQLFTNKNIGKGFMANHVLAYFTIQTNILSALLFLYLVVKTIVISIKNKQMTIVFFKPTIEVAVTLYITITMLVYWLALAPMLGIQTEPLPFFNTLFLHTLTPIFTIIEYIFFCEHGKLNRYDPLKWLAYPIFYLILVVIIANTSNVPYYQFPFKGEKIPLMYPYPFLEPKIVGVGGVVGIVIGLIVVFLALAYLYIFIDNKIKKHKDKKKEKIEIINNEEN